MYVFVVMPLVGMRMIAILGYSEMDPMALECTDKDLPDEPFLYCRFKSLSSMTWQYTYFGALWEQIYNHKRHQRCCSTHAHNATLSVACLHAAIGRHTSNKMGIGQKIVGLQPFYKLPELLSSCHCALP